MRYLERFEHLIVLVLVVLMTGVVLLATLELAWILVKDVMTSPVFLLEIQELLDLFGLFLVVLIGIELLHSVRTYVLKREFHLETVLAVSTIAVARKIIILDPKELSPGTLLGMAALVLALAFAFYVMRSGDRPPS